MILNDETQEIIFQNPEEILLLQEQLTRLLMDHMKGNVSGYRFMSCQHIVGDKPPMNELLRLKIQVIS